jgi:hypothetical protein
MLYEEFPYGWGSSDVVLTTLFNPEPYINVEEVAYAF